MGLFGKIGLGTMAVLALLAESMPVAAGIYVPHYQVPAESVDTYMVLEEELGEYEICEGDSLWNIAENFLGKVVTLLFHEVYDDS